MVIIFMLRYIPNKWSDKFYLWATKHWNCQTSFKIPINIVTLLYFILKKEHVWNKLKLYSYGSLWRCLPRWLYSTFVPILSPPGVMGLLSPAQVFLLTEISHSSRIRSTLAPSVPLDFRSTNTRWLSVPPEKSVSFIVRKYQYFKTSGCLYVPLSNIKHYLIWLTRNYIISFIQ